MDQAWVRVTLKDQNDNPPQFVRHEAHVTVREDVTPGTLLVSFPADDRDEVKLLFMFFHVQIFSEKFVVSQNSGSH